MMALKRGLATLINSLTAALTLSILPIILLIINKPLIGQSLFNTKRFSSRIGNLVYGIVFSILCITVVGFIIVIIWCVLGKDPLAFTITKSLGFK